MTIPQGKQAKRKQAASISAHRLFPVVMMVWFAALLGLTSFVVPPRMLASLVVASGLPKVLPAAAPPLGFTARVLVAFALAVVGGLIGLVIAARLRRGKAAKLDMPATPDRDEAMESGAPAVAVSQRAVKIRARDAHPDAPPRRPLVLSEELATVPALEDPEPGGELEQPVIAEDWGAEVPVDGADLSRTALEAADPDEAAGQDDVLADEVGAPARLAAPMIDDGPFAPPLLALPAALADEPSADADLDLAGLEAPPGEDDARLPLASDTQRPFVQPYPTLPAPGIFNDAAEARADAPAMDAAPLELWASCSSSSGWRWRSRSGATNWPDTRNRIPGPRRKSTPRRRLVQPRTPRTRPNRAWRTRKQVGRRMRRLSWRSCPARHRCPNTAIPRWSICRPPRRAAMTTRRWIRRSPAPIRRWPAVDGPCHRL